MPALAGIPTAIICGDKDRMTPLDRSQAIADVLPDAEFVVAVGSGHMAMMEDPTLTNDALRRMLQRAVRYAQVGPSRGRITPSQGPPDDHPGHRRGDPRPWARALGNQLRAGDLVILSGSLGAGKTTLTKGIATGMGVTGRVTSPTFVIARVHRPDPDSGRTVPLVHVDAYRLAGAVELDDLDLDTDLDAAAVVIEWGEGVAEQLSERTADHRAGPAAGRHPDRRADPGRRILAGPGGRVGRFGDRRKSLRFGVGRPRRLVQPSCRGLPSRVPPR